MRPALSLAFTSQLTPAGAPELGNIRLLLDACKAANPARLWVNEYHSPHPLGPFPPTIPLLGYIAGRAPGLPLGTSVLVPGLHRIEPFAANCAFLARAADFVLGIGTGYRADYERFGLRQQTWRELIDLIPRLRSQWTDDTTPFRPGTSIPVVVGSAGTRTLKAAAEEADGVVLHPSQPLAALEKQTAIARSGHGARARVSVLRDAVLGNDADDCVAYADKMIKAKYREYTRIGRRVVSDDLEQLRMADINYSTMGRRIVVGGVEAVHTAVDDLADLSVDEVILRVTYPEWSLGRAREALHVFKCAATGGTAVTPA